MEVVFYRTERGREPVRDWLRALTKTERRIVGTGIKTVQFSWPLGMPLVRKLEPDLREIRSNVDQRIARTLFTVVGNRIVLLHGFVMKARKTPKSDLELARRRRRSLEV
jgi:phage-related protein